MSEVGEEEWELPHAWSRGQPRRAVPPHIERARLSPTRPAALIQEPAVR